MSVSLDFRFLRKCLHRSRSKFQCGNLWDLAADNTLHITVEADSILIPSPMLFTTEPSRPLRRVRRGGE